MELLKYETKVHGLNLTHSQDKDYVYDVVHSVSIILNSKYLNHWMRIKSLTSGRAEYLIDSIKTYINILSESQHDTYTNPFEIVAPNIVLGLDIVTPESLFGYEPESVLPPGDHQPYTTEKVILPDTSQFLENTPITTQSPGPLVSFPKYNNYLQDKAKFDKYSKIFVPLKLLGIKPLESGELITKHSLPDNRAVISYAQYKEAGILFPTVYDDSVIRRWGVDVIIGSPLLSVSILVPEYVEAITKQNHPRVHFDDVNLDMINVSDREKTMKKTFVEAEVKLHENDAHYYRMDENHRRRRNTMTKRLMYKSLTTESLKMPIRLQIWLDPNLTVFNERSNPQCVHWSTVRG